MTDPTNQVTPPEKPKVGMPRVVAGVLAGGISSWFLTYCSLKGVNFQALGFDSEVVKSSITGALVGFFIAPDTTFAAVRDFLIWGYGWCHSLYKAATQGKE